MFRLFWPKLGMFRLSWPMFRLSRPKSGMFCFCARPMFRLSRPKLGMFRLSRPMFWLCSTYALTVLDLCFDCARPMFRLRSNYGSTLSTEIVCSYFVDLCFKFLDGNRVYFDSRPIFWLSQPKYRMFRLYAWLKVRSFWPKLGRFRLS